MDDVAIGRRVAAARKRAGIEQRKTLTDAAKLHRVGPATLGKIERGERHLFPHEADTLARVLEVDRSFFYENDEPDPSADQDGLADSLEQIHRKLDLLLIAAGISLPDAPTGEPEIPRYPRRPDEDQQQAPGA